MMTVASSNAPVSFRCPTPPPTGQPMDTVNDLAVTLRQHQGFASLMAVMTRRGSAVPVFDISVSPGTKFLRTVTVTTRLDHSSGELPATPSLPSFSGAASPTCRERSADCGSPCATVSARSTRNRSDGIIKYRTPAPIPCPSKAGGCNTLAGKELTPSKPDIAYSNITAGPTDLKNRLPLLA